MRAMKQHITCREALNKYLPRLLTPDASKAVTGAELVTALSRIDGFPAYSPKTVRYHLSIASQNPASCIVSKTGSQGYYLRSREQQESAPGYYDTVKRKAEIADKILAIYTGASAAEFARKMEPIMSEMERLNKC